MSYKHHHFQVKYARHSWFSHITMLGREFKLPFSMCSSFCCACLFPVYNDVAKDSNTNNFLWTTMPPRNHVNILQLRLYILSCPYHTTTKLQDNSVLVWTWIHVCFAHFVIQGKKQLHSDLTVPCIIQWLQSGKMLCPVMSHLDSPDTFFWISLSSICLQHPVHVPSMCKILSFSLPNCLNTLFCLVIMVGSISTLHCSQLKNILITQY